VRPTYDRTRLAVKLHLIHKKAHLVSLSCIVGPQCTTLRHNFNIPGRASWLDLGYVTGGKRRITSSLVVQQNFITPRAGGQTKQTIRTAQGTSCTPCIVSMLAVASYPKRSASPYASLTTPWTSNPLRPNR
jgi:hypothetical protein